MRKKALAELLEKMVEKVAADLGVDKDMARSFVGARIMRDQNEIVESCKPVQAK